MRKLALFIIIVVLQYEILYCQQSELFTLYANGYIFNIGGLIVFQPYDKKESNKNVLELLDSRSFEIGNLNSTCTLDIDLICLESIGDSFMVYMDKVGKLSCHVFYCQIKLGVDLWGSPGFETVKYNPSRYAIWTNDQKYNICGMWISNKVLQIVPEEKKYLEQLRMYFINNGYLMPKWLKEIN